MNEVGQTRPTIGFNTGEVQIAGVKFNVYDVGGQDTIRSSWHYFGKDAQAVVYVVDAADRNRIEITKKELHNLVILFSYFF